MAALTKAEAKAYKFVERHIRLHGYAPTFRDIAAGLHLKSPGYVHRLIVRVASKGMLKLTPGTSNGIELGGSNA